MKDNNNKNGFSATTTGNPHQQQTPTQTPRQPPPQQPPQTQQLQTQTQQPPPPPISPRRVLRQYKPTAVRMGKHPKQILLLLVVLMLFSPSMLVFFFFYYGYVDQDIFKTEDFPVLPTTRPPTKTTKSKTNTTKTKTTFSWSQMEDCASAATAAVAVATTEEGAPAAAKGAVAGQRLCCAPWTWNTDDWWTHHPEWNAVHDNATHTCFARWTDPAHIAFVQQLHSRQWLNRSQWWINTNGTTEDVAAVAAAVAEQCASPERHVQATQIASGYAAALMAIARSWNAVYQEEASGGGVNNKSFQWTRAHAQARWNFAPADVNHWAYCKTMDMNCYYLPISPCPAIIGRNDAPRGTKPTTAAARRRFRWLRQYAFRVRHTVRWQLQKYVETSSLTTLPAAQRFFAASQSPSNRRNCTVIHVRRGDIAFGKGRRYAAVFEYLEAGNVTEGETVLLMTDDVSAVQEVEKYHLDEYDWVYLQKPRFMGPAGGFEGFIPSNDTATEILAILAELQWAARCNKLVHGKSGFVALIVEAMENAGQEEVQTIYLQTQQDKKQQDKMEPADRAAIYLRDIEERIAQRQAQRKQQQ